MALFQFQHASSQRAGNMIVSGYVTTIPCRTFSSGHAAPSSSSTRCTGSDNGELSVLQMDAAVDGAPFAHDESHYEHDRLLGADGTALASASADDAVLPAQPSDPDAPGGGQLTRSIGLWSGASLVVGLVIGSGIFASPGSVVRATGCVGMTLAVWVFAGLLALGGALCYAELGTAIPRSGAEYAYLDRAYGPAISFLFTWTNVFIVRPGSQAIISLVFADYLTATVARSPSAIAVKATAAACVAAICVVNCLGVRHGTRMQNVLTAAKVLAIAFVVVLGTVGLAQHKTDSFHAPFEGMSRSPSSYGVAVVSCLWAYDGWNNMNYVAEELVDVSRNLPRGIGIAMAVVITCYVAINVAYFAVLSPAAVASATTAVATEVGRQMIGRAGTIIIPLCVAASAFGACNGTAFTGARIVYVAARDGQLPALLGRVHKTRATPINALVFQAVVAIALVLPGSFDVLVNFFSLAAWVFYALTAAALVVLRVREPSLARPYRVPLFIPPLFIATALALIVSILADAPAESGVSACIMLSGVPVWAVFVRDNGSAAHRMAGALRARCPWAVGTYKRFYGEGSERPVGGETPLADNDIELSWKAGE